MRNSDRKCATPNGTAVRRAFARLAVSIGSLAGLACTQPVVTPPAPAPAPAPVVVAPPPRPVPTGVAAAVLRDPSGRQVGSLILTDTYAGLLITGFVGDLGLGGHAMHIHSVGRCDPPFNTAGEHFNPTNRVHGYKNPDGPHLGDLPNLDLPAAGRERFEVLAPDVFLRGRNGLLDLDGASIVIHASRDDYIGDPSGNSGGRIACGVIVAR
jgi:Cu-Zn family superoxide dismutase